MMGTSLVVPSLFHLHFIGRMEGCESQYYSGLVAECMTSLYRRDLTTTSGGNVSIKSPDGRIWMTPTVGSLGAVDFDREWISAM